MRGKGFQIEETIGGKPKGVGKVTRGESESGGPTHPARVPWEKPS